MDGGLIDSLASYENAGLLILTPKCYLLAICEVAQQSAAAVFSMSNGWSFLRVWWPHGDFEKVVQVRASEKWVRKGVIRCVLGNGVFAAAINKSR